MKYYLGEQDPDGTEYCNLTRTCTWWEVDELGRQTSDTNLGDFLIKLPNPDNLPPRYAEVYKALKD